MLASLQRRTCDRNMSRQASCDQDYISFIGRQSLVQRRKAAFFGKVEALLSQGEGLRYNLDPGNRLDIFVLCDDLFRPVGAPAS